jgi:hypothetical protein
MNPIRRMCAVAALTASTATPAYVNEVLVNDDPDNVVLRHIHTAFAHFAEAASGWYDATVGRRPVSDEDFATFSRQFLTGTFAEFEYQYEDPRGGVHVRVYHGSSGPVEPRVGVRGVYATHSVDTFSDYGDFAVLVRNVDLDDTDVTPSTRDDRGAAARRNDAELRIARAIERDIREGVVHAGGRIAGFVSQPMCASCRAAVEALERNHGIQATITALDNPSAAYRRFNARRTQYMAAVLRRTRGLPNPEATPAPLCRRPREQ